MAERTGAQAGGALVVVGSVAIDTIETQGGRAAEVLGGAATYFAVAASFFTPVQMVGVVGEDFPEERARVVSPARHRPQRARGPARTQHALDRALPRGHERPRHAELRGQRLRRVPADAPRRLLRRAVRVSRQHRAGAADPRARPGPHPASRRRRHDELLHRGRPRASSRRCSAGCRSSSSTTRKRACSPASATWSAPPARSSPSGRRAS